MNILKYIFVLLLFSISISVMAEEIICPEGETLVPYHNSCMAVPVTPPCPEGETWIPYHNSCAVLATQVDEDNI
jgi:hypothetical protein